MGILDFEPPLLNSANPWCTTVEQLRDLYACPHTGAITVRTATLHGFAHDDKIHQYGFFDTGTHTTPSGGQSAPGSLNTLGYSPVSLAETLQNVRTIVAERRESGVTTDKPIIISITGAPEELGECIKLIDAAQHELGGTTLLVEINLSCPNITGKPPPAFSLDGLLEYLSCLKQIPGGCSLSFGIKIPPYSNPENFTNLKRALQAYTTSSSGSSTLSIPLHFITSTNTLGYSLLLDEQFQPRLSSADGSGIGGLAGTPLHPLALGNVRTIRNLLDDDTALSSIEIIGVGGVSDTTGFQKMRSVGAKVVAVGTALGANGVAIFERILPKTQE